MSTEDEEAVTCILQDRLSRGYVIKTQRKKQAPGSHSYRERRSGNSNPDIEGFSV